ncbi:hypothetical protein, partial [Huaxiibacter chinensis]|uniref:hypothetical protein n=1 Tax=Huaxiibacter chinensis TaxID=2899785 RepID=UPI003F95FFD2
MVNRGSFYSTLLRENVTGLTHDCEEGRKEIHLHDFSAVESIRMILPLTPRGGIHIMPPVNTTALRWGYSSAGRALAWHARGQ